jgi:hypothetical protein
MGTVVPASVIIPIVSALKKYRRLSKACRYMVLYLLFTAIINALAQLLAAVSINNMPLLHADTALETVLLLLYFRSVLRGRNSSNVTQGLLILFPLICLLNFSFFQSIYSFNTYTRPLEAIIFIGCCFAFFFQGMAYQLDWPWTEQPHNWMVSGLLLYFSSSLFLFLFSNFLASGCSAATNITIWNIHAALVLLMYLLITLGFLQCH